MKQVPGLGTRLENEGSQVNAAMIHSDSQEPCHHFDRFDGERAACFYCLVPQDDKRTAREQLEGDRPSPQADLRIHSPPILV